MGAGAARRALASAGVGVHDIDVFGLYDPNSFEVLRQFELLGLCEEGEGGPFAETGLFELGGKSANLTFADADLDAAARRAANGIAALSGQACVAPTRLLIERSVYQQVIDRVVDNLAKVSLA